MTANLPTPIQQAADENTSSALLRQLASQHPELGRLVALNPSANLELLRELASRSDPVVRQHLVMNPNTPPEVLLKLAGQFPRHLFSNPAIDLLLLENPNLLAGTSATALCSLLKRTAPVSFLEYAANSTDERVQMAVAMNEKTPKTILERLAQSESQRVVEAAPMHINWAGEITADWETVAHKAIKNILLEQQEDFESALGQIAKIREFSSDIPKHLIPSNKVNYHQIPANELENLAQSTSWQDRKQAAQNPNTPVHVLKKLLEEPDTYGDIGRCVAGNPNLPLHLLEELANSNRHNAVHRTIAVNSKTPVSILEKLAENPRLMNYVHEEIANNPSTPISLLEKLANHRSGTVQVIVANNPKTPKSLVMNLLERFERQGGYTLTIGTNPYLSASFLEKLLRIAQKELKTAWHKEQTNSYKNALSVIARHPNLSETSLRKLLLEDKEQSIRLAAASNPNTPKYILEVWGLDILDTMKQGIVNIRVLEAIARSLYATDCLLAELVKHENHSVRIAAASNPCASDRILEQWESSSFYTAGELEKMLACEQQTLEKWEASVLSASRLTVLLHPQAPVPILAKVSRSSYWLERYAIATHPHTPSPVRQRLAQDSNCVVRAVAKANGQVK